MPLWRNTVEKPKSVIFKLSIVNKRKKSTDMLFYFMTVHRVKINKSGSCILKASAVEGQSITSGDL